MFFLLQNFFEKPFLRFAYAAVKVDHTSLSLSLSGGSASAKVSIRGSEDSCNTLSRLEFNSWRRKFLEESALVQGMEGITFGIIPSIPSAKTRTHPATQPPLRGGVWWGEVFEIRFSLSF